MQPRCGQLALRRRPVEPLSDRMNKHPANTTKAKASDKGRDVKADLVAVVAAVNGNDPRVLTLGQTNALPSGPFELVHRSLQSGLRIWVEQLTGQPLGYIEQLYTFADRDRTGAGRRQRMISISYLALTREEPASGPTRRNWRNWYDYLPWEDHRLGTPPVIAEILKPRLLAWIDEAKATLREERSQRVMIAFGFGEHAWNEELTLQRYELLYEAGLVDEAVRAGALAAPPQLADAAMVADHRRILATGIARLRAKIKYRPVVFELMPPRFTLLQLQRTVEALAGRALHKQNFRRLIEQQNLVEGTGQTMVGASGRPAELFRFRHAVVAERAVAGTKLPLMRA